MSAFRTLAALAEDLRRVRASQRPVTAEEAWAQYHRAQRGETVSAKPLSAETKPR